MLVREKKVDFLHVAITIFYDVNFDVTVAFTWIAARNCIQIRNFGPRMSVVHSNEVFKLHTWSFTVSASHTIQEVVHRAKYKQRLLASTRVSLAKRIVHKITAGFPGRKHIVSLAILSYGKPKPCVWQSGTPGWLSHHHIIPHLFARGAQDPIKKNFARTTGREHSIVYFWKVAKVHLLPAQTVLSCSMPWNQVSSHSQSVADAGSVCETRLHFPSFL